jgi:hypothetical protein
MKIHLFSPSGRVVGIVALVLRNLAFAEAASGERR